MNQVIFLSFLSVPARRARYNKPRQSSRIDRRVTKRFRPMQRVKDRGMLLDELRYGLESHDVQPRCRQFQSIGVHQRRGEAKQDEDPELAGCLPVSHWGSDRSTERPGQRPAGGSDQKSVKSPPRHRRGCSTRSQTSGSTRRENHHCPSRFDVAELPNNEGHEKDCDNMGTDVQSGDCWPQGTKPG